MADGFSRVFNAMFPAISFGNPFHSKKDCIPTFCVLALIILIQGIETYFLILTMGHSK